MNQTNKINPIRIIVGILFVILSLTNLNSIITSIRYDLSIIYVFSNLISFAGCVILAGAAFTNKRDHMLAIGFALIALSVVIEFFMGFGTHLYEKYEYHSRYYTDSYHTYEFNLMLLIPHLVNMIGCLGVAALAAIHTTNLFPLYRNTAKQLWFVPAACCAGRIVLQFISGLIVYGSFHVGGFFTNIFFAAAVLLTSMWLVFPDGFPNQPSAFDGQQSEYDGYNSNTNGYDAAEQLGYCDLAKHILLLLFTFGIWYYIWIYKTTKNLNRVNGEPWRTPSSQLLLCMFIPFYSIYWIYQSALRIDKMARENDITSDISTICVILAIFVAIVPPIIMQDKLNSIIKPASGGFNGTPYQQSQPVSADVTEELRKYKELLDEGIITQEEFEQKKKQLLGL